MKNRVIFTSLFAIVLFAGVAKAQDEVTIEITDFIIHSSPKVGKRTIKSTEPPTTRAQIWRNVGGTWTLLSSTSVGMATVQAGASVAIRVAMTGQAKVPIAEGVLPFSYQVPCEGIPPAASSIDYDKGVVTLTGTVASASNWNTDKRWRGTCRMLVFRTRHNVQYGTRVRFR